MTPGPAPAPAPGPRWNLATILLHWLSAGVVIGLLGLGWTMVHAPLAAAAKFDLYQLHKSIGVLALALTVARLSVRAVVRAPAPPAGRPRWEHPAAVATHVALLTLSATLVLSGWMVVSTAILPVPTRVFGLFVLPPLTGPNPALFERVETVHRIAGWALAGLVALHVAAAAKHRLVDRDDVLSRMSPFRRRAAPQRIRR